MKRNICPFMVGAIIGLTFATSTMAQTADAAKWQELIKNAQKEHSFGLVGPPDPHLRTDLPEAFTKRYGIDVDYLPLNGAETMTRVDLESKAGRTTIDAVIGGTGSCWTMVERGQIENINGKIIDPAVVDPSVWTGGSLRFIDGGPVPSGTPADFRCGFQPAEWVMTDLFVNTTVIRPGEITSWKDLLKPEYKGRIVSYDPRRAGPATTTVSYLNYLFGQDFLKSLYLGQSVHFTADHRQLAEWVARGEYPIGLSLVQFAVEPFRRQGLPIERVFPADGPGSVMGGFSVIALVKNSAHPNAAQLFVNWYATQEAQTIYERDMMEASLRKDVTGTNVPDYIRPKPGATYVDAYKYDYNENVRGPALDMLQKALER